MSLSPASDSDLMLQARDAAARGDYVQAHAIGVALLQRLPKNPQVNLLMGEVCLATGFLEMAIKYRKFAVDHLPPSPMLEAQLAQAYSHSGRLGDALAHYAKAIRLDPSFTPAIAGRAEVYEMQGNFKRSWKTLEPALKAMPTDPSLAAVAVRVLMELRRLDDAIEIGERVLTAQLPEEPQLRSTLLSLAKAYERAKRYRDALEIAAQGNAMLSVPFDSAQYQAETDALIETFDKEWMQAGPRATNDASWAVFIVGMPRSGSTLTERIIHSHPQAFGADEDFTLQLLSGSIEHEFEIENPWPRNVQELTAEQLELCGQKYERAMRTQAPDARLISNKDLANMRRLGFADRILPGAKFIHTRRNPTDNCLSCYLERLRPAAIPYASSFEDLAFAYAENERLWAHWRQACENDILTVEYEDLVTDLPGTARKIIDFVGLPWDDRCLKPHEANRADRTLSVTQVRRPIYKSAKGRAARYGELIQPLRDALQRHGVEA